MDVEFLDKKGWLVKLELKPPESNTPDLWLLIQRLQGEKQTTYTTRIEAEVPASIPSMIPRLVSKDEKEKSELIPFIYLPSEAPPLPLKEEEELVSTEYISSLLGEKKTETPYYLAMVKKDAAKAPVGKQVLRER